METNGKDKKNIVISRRTGVTAAVAAGLLILFTIAIASAAVVWSSGPHGLRTHSFHESGVRMMGESRHMAGGSSRFDSADATQGTVTSVSGDSFTLAGHGSTTQVKTSSSTQYKGGNQVKVNDTVIAFGATTDGTLDATRIVINP
jgi:hypothetical protein